jgi:2-polyprenyl-6-methoxyphenol hydroxylase-like FAD-dependent oxidoreductase
VEDGAVLGAVIFRCENEDEIEDVLRVYEEIRMPRAKKVARLSGERRGMMLGEEGQGFRSPWGDEGFENELFGYDVEGAVEAFYERSGTGFEIL